MPPIIAKPQENGSIQFSLGKLEMASVRAQQDVETIRSEMRDLPKAIREELKAEIKESLQPLELRISKLETKVTDTYETIIKWRAMVGIIAIMAGAFGAIISQVSVFKKLISG